MNEDLQCVAVLEREVAASLERVLENVLDWEHLPWLHAGSFCGISLESASDEGWRAQVLLPPAAAPRAIGLAVELDRAALRYVSRTLEGPGAGTEIWTQLLPRAARTTAIRVTFHVPGVAPASVRPIGEAFVQLYTRLWDEDEAMMLRRQAVLDRRRAEAGEGGARETRLALGPLVALRSRLPLELEARGRGWRIVEHGGELLVHTTECPHFGGPLGAAALDGRGALVCPWHGYRFDLRTGRSCDGRRLALARPPQLRVDAASGEVELVFPDESAPPARAGAR